MPEAFPFDVKEQVRQATDIVDLVGAFVPLRRSGQNFVGLCPWHDDSRPSLQVDPRRQSFKCWVCDIGGDVFSFLMKQENLDFREALEALAERAGIPIGPRGRATPNGTDVAQNSPTGKKELLAANSWAESLFHNFLLNSDEAEPAREYLAKRQIDSESITRFRIGFAPAEWDWLLRQAPAAKIAHETLESLGLIKQRTGGDGYFDFFRGRVMFPIRDPQHRAIAFGGRVLPQLAREGDAKYFNSPESPLFSKSNQLYGLDLAQKKIGRPGQPDSTVVVMEGYTDCIMAHQHGVANAVAVLGTSLTDRHIPLLRRYADTVLLVLDGDEAGQRRASEVLELFVAGGVDLRILTLPRDTDPCDFIAAHGGAAFRILLSEAVDALEHKIQTVTKGMETATDTHRANTAVEEILGTLSSGPRPAISAAILREQQVLSQLARRFHLPETALRSRLQALRRGRRAAARSGRTATSPTEKPACDDKPALDAWDRELIELMLVDDQSCQAILESLQDEDIRSEAGRVLFALARSIHASGAVPNFDQWMLATDDPAIKNLLVELDEESEAKKASDTDQRLRDVAERIRQSRARQESRRQLAALRDGKLADQTENEVFEQFIQNVKSRQLGSEPTDG